MKYLLDTNVMIDLLTDEMEVSHDVKAIIGDYYNLLQMCAASIRELVAKWYKSPLFQKRWKTPEIMINFLIEEFGIAVSYPKKEHYKTFVNMEWNWAEKHTDTTDILIVAHAITEKTPLISSDGKLDFYKKQGLNLIFNKRRQINDKR